MNITLAAADIARRIPEMAKDTPVNNEGVVQRILEAHKAYRVISDDNNLCPVCGVLDCPFCEYVLPR